MTMTIQSLFGPLNIRTKTWHSLMFMQTTIMIPASAASGISFAWEPNSSKITVSVTAWMMPATGVRAPLRMFVAVRAIAPVAGIPPKSTEPMLPIPCPISSVSGRWRSPVMPSATVALSSDSIAARSAMVIAGTKSCGSSFQRKSGREGEGSACGSSPNLMPIVSTSRWKMTAATVAASIPISMAGRRGNSLRQPRMTAVVPRQSRSA